MDRPLLPNHLPLALMLLLLLGCWAPEVSAAEIGVGFLVQDVDMDFNKKTSEGVVVTKLYTMSSSGGFPMSSMRMVGVCWEPHWADNTEARVICRELGYAGGCRRASCARCIHGC